MNLGNDSYKALILYALFCIFRVLELREDTKTIEENISDFLHFKEFNDNENIMEKLESKNGKWLSIMSYLKLKKLAKLCLELH